MKQGKLQRLLAWFQANPAVAVGVVFLLMLIAKPEHIQDLVTGFLDGPRQH